MNSCLQARYERDFLLECKNILKWLELAAQKRLKQLESANTGERCEEIK